MRPRSSKCNTFGSGTAQTGQGEKLEEDLIERETWNSLEMRGEN